AGQRAGLSDNLIMELAAIFGWDVDFALDIREGDEFAVIYEEHFLDGEKLRDGAIIGAEFVNQGQRYQAVRYTDPEGRGDYFTPDGMSMRKAFLRTPVEFSRISSRFGTRKHPVLNKFRAHKGVDYAAPQGTPIKAAGDGKVIFAGTKGGYGRTAIIQHGGRYSTLYAHMSKFARGVRSGKYVRQGQTIGYVGSSGLATGPHLHYEFRVNGVHRNPLTVKLPEAAPISAALKSDFIDHADRLTRQLNAHRESRIALNAN
ncbi:MAG: peptidase M23, partial [Gammaproteobacteria bacterium SG8_47]